MPAFIATPFPTARLLGGSWFPRMMDTHSSAAERTVPRVDSQIFPLRGVEVFFDRHLAALDVVEIKNLSRERSRSGGVHGPSARLESEQGTDPVSAQGTDPVTAQVAAQVTAQGTDPVSAQGTDPVTAQGTDPVSAQVADPVTAQVTAQGTDPVSAQGTDPVAAQGTDPVQRVVMALVGGELAPSALWARLGLKHRPTFRENDLRPAIAQGLIEATIPEKPPSRL
jgi:hypothetical protein